ncbi:armadillo-type protein [Crucibulum laeve]|uniref:Armadillo-type protein n=1 Tax=Crucibulum laeve TaxID=68775 RepID=A0A5C3MG78_9AGAR|nr:armadillo-type protein [Crucibulum laeve]
MNHSGRPIASGLVVEHVSPTELYQVLIDACSQNTIQVQASSKRLKDMLDMLGTFDALYEIAAERTVALPVRQQAIIQFKNAALSHWKSRKLLSDEHRVRIRSRCLTFLEEPDETIAECNEVIVSKIARQDYPNNWPTLINDLLGVVDSNLNKRYSSPQEDPRDTLMLRRGLKLLNGILKEFSGMKMLSGVKVMANIVEQLRVLLSNYYSKMTPSFSPDIINVQNIGSPRIYDEILLTHLVYKTLTKMGIWLWNRIDKLSDEERHKNQTWISELFQASSIQLPKLVQIRKELILTLIQRGSTDDFPRRSTDILSRHIRAFGKFFRRLQQLSHARFVNLPMCGDLILFYWSQVVEATGGATENISDSNDALYPVRFLVQGMVLFKENLAQWTPVRRDGTANKNSLSKEFVDNAVRMLVTRFMPLNPTDLGNWMADPEEWVNLEDKENDQWEFEIRPCSERVLMQLSNQFHTFVTPLLTTMFNELAPQRPNDLVGVIQKEALYCAIGRCALRLKDSIPFEQWLEHTLVTEARDPNPSYPIIKRRIAWLIGKWVSESCTSPSNPKVWEVLVHLLQDRGEGTDAVVRLTAATSLRECIDTLEFVPDVFTPFLPATVSELVRLIGEAETMESKRRVDTTLNTVIEQAGTRIIPFVPIITEPLPQIWNSAEDDWLFKASLLVTVTKLVESVKEQSTNLGNIVVPLIRESLLPGVIVHLDEDGLGLWLTALRNTMTITSVNGAPALYDLFPQALSLLATNLDLLGKINSIVESYLFLDALGILQAFSLELFNSYTAAFKSDAATLNLKDMLISLSLLLQIAPSSLWGESLHTSGLFAHLLIKLIEGESDATLLTHHIFFFSRLVMADRQMFLQLMSVTAAALGQKDSYLYEGLLDQWWGKFDNMSEPRHRKLVGMGIAALVSTGRTEVLQRLPTEIFNLWLDVFGEIKEVQADLAALESSEQEVSPTSLKRFWELDEAPAAYYQDTEGTPEYERRKAVYDRDPVRTVQLSAFVGAHVREAEALCGPQAFQAYLSKADPTVLSQVQNELLRG